VENALSPAQIQTLTVQSDGIFERQVLGGHAAPPAVFPSMNLTKTNASATSANSSPNSSFQSERPTVSRRQIPPWAPLRSPVFRALWLASLASNIGTWMHEVGAAWLMTSLTKSEQMNALVAAAGTLPMFLLALPAGALADIVDRRKLVIYTQTWATLVAGTLSVLTLLSLTGPWVLLFFTLLMALGGAMTGPAWQSLLPEMVKKRQLPAAMSLGGAAWNLSRIVGPLLGGAIIGFAANVLPNRATAPGVVFGVNALSFLAVVFVFARWRRVPREVDLPPEHILSAMRTGWRYTRHSPELRAILVRTFGLMVCISAQFSLLPLYTREVLGLNATGYASLLGFFGAAGVGGNLLYPRLSRLFDPSRLLFYTALLSACNLLVLAWVPGQVPDGVAVWIVRFSMLLGGLAWPIAIQTCNVNIVRSVPDWVRSRAAGMFTLVFMGSSTLGSVLWGSVASIAGAPGRPGSGIPVAFLGAALGLLGGLLVLRRFVIVDPGNANFAPSQHWPGPALAFEPEPDRGPVLVTVEYEIDSEDTEAFVAAMQPVRLLRLRDGALRWNLFQDAAEPSRWVETMLVESWNEHLRQHARVTHADREVEAAAHAYHRGESPPRVSHLIASSARPRPEEPDEE
jgi:predicted MFS family arabinose efflux permease/quinol monooxygenase YgiN